MSQPEDFMFLLALAAERRQQPPRIRTDPWRWYCRLCGADGVTPTRIDNYAAAQEHLATTPCGGHAYQGSAESGHLLHVWTYGNLEES